MIEAALDALPGRTTVAEIMAEAPADAWFRPDPEDTIYLELENGERVVILLVPELSPGHAKQVRTLAREGYYERLHFYRVPEGFVAQGGDESGEKSKGSAAETLTSEFEAPWPDGLPFTPLGHDDSYAAQSGFVRGVPAGRDPDAGTGWLAHCTGAFAFGREEGRDTASTEFYVTLQPQRYLDRNLTVLGRVVWNMPAIQAIPRNEPNNGGVMQDRARWTPIASVRVASDVDEADRTDVEVMDTASETFRQLLGARAARADAFFYHRPDHVDLCQMPVPVRLAE